MDALRERQLIDIIKEVIRTGSPGQKKSWETAYRELYRKAKEEVDDETAAEKTKVRTEKIDKIFGL